MPTPDFTKMVPGFDFLQSLMKGAGAGLPSMNQWIAPTLDADEVDKRIRELRTVQFWLEQNAKMLGATIQALEVQRMTLATLQTMKVPVDQLRDAMKLDPSAFMPRTAAAEAAPPAAPPAPAPAPEAAPEAAPDATPDTAASAEPAAPQNPAIDPMQWWGALTRQFTELAANALKDNPVEAATQMAGTAFKQAVQPMADAAKAMAGRAAAGSARRAAPTAPSATRPATPPGKSAAKKTPAARKPGPSTKVTKVTKATKAAARPTAPAKARGR